MSESIPSPAADVAPPESPGKISKTVAYYAAFICLGLVAASLGPTLPGLAEHTRTRLGEISFLFTARSLGYLIGSFRGGRLYDRVPGHPLMGAVLLIMAAMMALAPLISMLWILAAVLLVLGVAEGMLDVGGNVLLVRVHPRNLDPFMNGLHFFFGVGAFLSPIVVVQAVLMSGGITWAYWMLALLVLPVAVYVLRLPSPETQTAPRIGSDRKADPVLIALIAICFYLAVGAEVGFAGWIFTYAVEMGLSGEAAAGYLTSAFWGALTLGRLLGIPISARFGPRTILFGDLLGCFLSVGVILIWPHSLTATWVGALGIGLSIASMFATLLNLADRHMAITGRITGWFFVGSSTGGMTLPYLIGQLFEPVGPQVTMFVILGDLVAALGIFVILMLYLGRRSRRQKDRV